MTPPERGRPVPVQTWVKLLGLITVPLLGFWLYGLFDIDEGFYASVVAEMNRRGEWITPFYNGHPWFEKPILLYWLAKPSVALFGGVFGLRLPCVVATLGLYAVAAWFASRRFSLRAAQWSVLILGSCVLVVYVGRSFMTDALLCLCLTAAFCTFFESLVGDRRLRLLAALFLGLSVLAKGPVGCILFVAIAGITYWRERELRPAFRGWWGLGLLIFAAVVASWYLPAYLANGRLFVEKFLIEQNWQRFLGGDKAHTVANPGMWLAYVPLLIVGMLPWTVWLWPALKGPGTSDDAPNASSGPASEAEAIYAREAARRFLVTWAAVVFVFFSVSGAKLPHYILPAIPPLAILIARLFAAREKEKPRSLVPTGAWVTIVIVACLVNAGMAAWYTTGLGMSAPQSQAHKLAREAKRLLAQDSEAGIALYRMGRLNKDMGTGKLKLQETDLPSLLFYLDRTALQPDDFRELSAAPKPLYILTRTGRLSPGEIRAANSGGTSLKVVDETDFYVLWLWEGVFRRDTGLKPEPGAHGDWSKRVPR